MYTNSNLWLSLESVWQQVSTGLQDFSKYSGWSLLCCCLNGFDSSSNILFSESLFQVFRRLFKELRIRLILLSLSCSADQGTFQFSAFFHFHYVICCHCTIHNVKGFVMSSFWILLLVFWPELGDPFLSQSPREFKAFHFHGHVSFFVCICIIC